MMTLVWRGILSRKLRASLTAIAILLGVAMVTGTLVLTDQIRTTFDKIFTTSVKGVDTVITPRKAFDTDFSELDPLPDSLVARISAVPGVKVASGQIQSIGALVVKGEVIKPAGGAPPLVASTLPVPLAPGTYIEGVQPTRHGEVAVDKSTADKADVTVGQRVGLTTRTGVEPVVISGIFKFGDAGSLAGATVVVPTFRDAQRWYDRVGKASTIVAAAEPGISETELTRRIAAVLPPTAEAKTATASAQENADDITGQIDSFLTPILLLFAFVAVLVGAFIIYNTFSITVAQRLREIGMLRTLGATKGQVMRSVVAEAFIIGVVASVVGFGAGILFDQMLLAVFDAVGFTIEVSGLEIAPLTVLAALGVGVVVTVLSSLIPAVRATKVPAVAAMREGAVLPRWRFARFTPWIATLLALAGLGLIAQGLFTDGGTFQRLGGIGVGALLVFLAVAVLARYLVGPISQVIGWPLERLSSGAGRLARENATRNPARTAITSSALMIGVGLVVFFAVFADGLKSSFTGAVDRSFRGDIVVLGQSFLPFPAGAESALSGVPGIQVASGVRFDTARIDGKGTKNFYGVDPERLPQVFGVEFQKGGSDALYAQLGSDGALVEENAAQSRNLQIGDSFTAQSPSGTKATYRIIGQYKDPTFANDGFIVSNTGFARIFTGTDLGFLAAKVADGQDASAVETAAKDALATAYPATDVQSNAEYKRQIEDNINGLLYLFYVLLAMAVIISIFGIINTLVLSITERTREIGMLRAIGVTRPQLRRMIRYESIITSVMGAILGLAIGILFAWIMTKGLEDEGITFSLPEIQLVVFLVLSVLVGILAAVLPARRAARLKVLDAIHYE